MAVMEAFPGATIGEIKTLAPAVEMPAIPDEIADDDD
jgi:DNA polymerase-3 subunit gamma/tau